MYRICLNIISPGFYFLPGSEEQPLFGTGVYKYLPVPTTRSTRKWPYKPHNWQFPWMLQPSPQLRKCWKSRLTDTCSYNSLQPRGRQATTFVMLSICWTATPTATCTCSIQRLLTWEPGIPPASKPDRHLFGADFYSSKYDTCSNF